MALKPEGSAGFSLCDSFCSVIIKTVIVGGVPSLLQRNLFICHREERSFSATRRSPVFGKAPFFLFMIKHCFWFTLLLISIHVFQACFQGLNKLLAKFVDIAGPHRNDDVTSFYNILEPARQFGLIFYIVHFAVSIFPGRIRN